MSFLGHLPKEGCPDSFDRGVLIDGERETNSLGINIADIHPSLVVEEDLIVMAEALMISLHTVRMYSRETHLNAEIVLI